MTTLYINTVQYFRTSLCWVQFFAVLYGSLKNWSPCETVSIGRCCVNSLVFARNSRPTRSSPPLLFLVSSGSRSIPGTRSFRGIISPHLTVRRLAAIYDNVASSFTGKTAWKVTVRFPGMRGRVACALEFHFPGWKDRFPVLKPFGGSVIGWSYVSIGLYLFVCSWVGLGWCLNIWTEGRKWNCCFNPFLFSSFVYRQSTCK